MFFTRRKPRVVTVDPWSFLRHVSVENLDKQREKAALAYIDQAYEFFEAAINPRISSRPLLYYYSFLNLAKVVLLHRGVNFPPLVRHGIIDPRVNVKRRLRFEGQTVRMEPARSDHAELFSEFVSALGGSVSAPRTLRVVDLLAQVPGIHRTYCKVTGSLPHFCPVHGLALQSGRRQVWCTLKVNRRDWDVKQTFSTIRGARRFRRFFTQIQSDTAELLKFESLAQAGQTRGVDAGIRRLASGFCDIGLWWVLTGDGYRLYLADFPHSRRLPQLASIHAVMFYLGSITRYKPYDFDRLVARDYAWLVSEFLATQPMQFLYGVASLLAGVDVVRPFGALG